MGQFLQTYGKEIFSLLVSIVTWAVRTGMKPKVRLIWSSPHAFAFRTPGLPPGAPAGQQPAAPTTIFTASVRLYNGGREAAHDVEMVFNFEPMLHNVWPAREFKKSIAADNRCTLTFNSLSPGEDLRIELLSVNIDLPQLLTVRCEEQLAKSVPLRFYPVVSQWWIRSVQGLALLGLGSAVYWVIVLIQLLVLRTPSP